MRPAPRELRMPCVFSFDFGSSSNGPIELKLRDMPFWDTTALLSAISYDVTAPATPGVKEIMPRREKRYRIAGLISTARSESQLSFFFDRATQLGDMITGVKEAYTNTLSKTYSERDRSLDRIDPSKPPCLPAEPDETDTTINQNVVMLRPLELQPLVVGYETEVEAFWYEKS